MRFDETPLRAPEQPSENVAVYPGGAERTLTMK
jgi:hypothetical protein